jgi:hypothetical protein
VLHGRSIEAVAIGWSTAGQDAIDVLSEWAHYIFMLDMTNGPHKILPRHRIKIVPFDVGPDRWSNPYNQELLEILGKKFNEFYATLPTED